MNKLFPLLILLWFADFIQAQTPLDSLSEKQGKQADDPASFITRIELFNELQYHDEDFYLNQTVLRTILKIGKRFTTRIDIPLVHNSLETSAGYQQFGLGDISFRLLGYKILESRKSAVTASVEISLNTAESPLLGLGKNIIIPVISYSRLIPKKKILLAVILQQANSFSGDETRRTVSFTKVQPILLKFWSKKVWSVVAPSIFIDYISDDVAMNLEGRTTFAPAPRINIWAQAGVGIFGNFAARYEWSAQLGLRYFMTRGSD